MPAPQILGEKKPGDRMVRYPGPGRQRYFRTECRHQSCRNPASAAAAGPAPAAGRTAAVAAARPNAIAAGAVPCLRCHPGHGCRAVASGHCVDHHLGGVTLDAVLFPLAGLQSALDVELGALAYIFADDLRQATEEHHAVPLGTFLLLTGLLVLPAVAGCQRHVGDGVAVGHVAHFRVAAHVTDQDYLVYASGHAHSPRVSGVCQTGCSTRSSCSRSSTCVSTFI